MHFKTEEKTLPCLIQTGESFSSVLQLQVLLKHYQNKTPSKVSIRLPAPARIRRRGRVRSVESVHAKPSPLSLSLFLAYSSLPSSCTVQICTSHLHAGKRLHRHGANLHLAFTHRRASVPARYKFAPRIYTQESVCTGTVQICTSHLHAGKHLYHIRETSV